ncbi:MAG TPA: hypothetical protein VGU66_17870 [Candidatus Elarobacter sp.]|nr:hypothetical protein [Candidatus Elarobacter sp.]
MTAEKRVKLRGILAQTASSAMIGDDGTFVVELYDFSAEAHRWLGNDVAFLLELGPAEKDAALRRLLGRQDAANASEPDAQLLQLVAERFDDYYAVEQWLNEQGIPFRKRFEPWA